MRKSIRIPVAFLLSLALTVPALAQSTNQAAATPAPAAKAAPAVDPNKVDLLHQEYVAKTAELRGKLAAAQAELETQLATKPDDAAAVKKLTTAISTLRGQLLDQTIQFRIKYAKETGTPIRMTRHLEHMGMGMEMMMPGGKSDDCKMMGKDAMPGMMMGKGMMQGMNMKGMNHDMKGAGQAAMSGMQHTMGQAAMPNMPQNMGQTTMPGMPQHDMTTMTPATQTPAQAPAQPAGTAN